MTCSPSGLCYFKDRVLRLYTSFAQSLILQSFLTYTAFFHLPYFTPVEEEEENHLCVILHTQAKGITANPLCSRRSLRVSRRYSLRVFSKEFSDLSFLKPVPRARTACLSVYPLLRSGSRSLHSSGFLERFPGLQAENPPSLCCVNSYVCNSTAFWTTPSVPHSTNLSLSALSSVPQRSHHSLRLCTRSPFFFPCFFLLRGVSLDP